MTQKHDITLDINGKKYELTVEPRRTLVDVIRDQCGQTGTHTGCHHGVCGACTICDDEPVRACLMFGIQADGKKIRTVEGLADGQVAPATASLHRPSRSTMRILHAWFSDARGWNIEKDPDISDDDLVSALSSNLCRCTGYANIITAVKAAAEQMRAG